MVLFITTAVFAPSLLCVGAIFPLAWECIERDRAHQGEPLGHATALNKLAAAARGAAGAVRPDPLVGAAGHAAAHRQRVRAAGDGVLARDAEAPERLGTRRDDRAGALGVAARDRLPPITLLGQQLRGLYQGADGVVAVLEGDAEGSRHIVLNQTYTLNGTQRALRAQQHESWIPLVMCPHPQRVAFIGMASGISAAAVLDAPVTHLDAIELVPRRVRAAREHFGAFNQRLFTDPRAQVVVNDGRNTVQHAPAP